VAPNAHDVQESRDIKVAKWKWEFVRRNPHYASDRDRLLGLGRQVTLFRQELAGMEDGTDDYMTKLAELERIVKSIIRNSERFETRWGLRLRFDFRPTGPIPPPPVTEDEGWMFYFLLGKQNVAALETMISAFLMGELPDPMRAVRSEVLSPINKFVRQIREYDRTVYEQIAEEHPSAVYEPNRPLADVVAASPERVTLAKAAIAQTIAELTDHIHIRIPLDMNTEEMLSQVRTVIRELKKAKRELGLERTHTRFDNFPTYLKIFDLKARRKSWRQIVEEVFPNMLEADPANPDKPDAASLQALTERAIENLTRARSLVDGEWKNIK